MRLGLSHVIEPRLAPLVEETRAFYASRGTGVGPRNRDELVVARAATKPAVPSHPPAVENVVHHEGRSVPIRVHPPTTGDVRGALLDVHGGGFYMGSATADDVRNQALADALRIAVVSVDYRLAPENPWPAAPDDSETAALWLAEHAAELFGVGRLAIQGFSAGATLAMCTLLRLRDRGVKAFEGSVLQFGTYDLSGLTPSGRLIADEYFIEAYVGSAPDRTVPDISPVFADLSGLPPTLMVIGEDDILLDDNFAMSARLVAAANDVELRVYPVAPHGFTRHPTPMATAAQTDIHAWLDALYDAGRT
ncbi:alpha/beta hydrolase [Microbacterium sp. NPDC089696]|uniref:alpha/beta hydrolase n=1 Tax=Microbacterium sp. NPDC089696 TaxID=3364199 RepID=UPI00380C9661